MNRRQALAGMLGGLAGFPLIDAPAASAEIAPTGSGPTVFPVGVSDDSRYLRDATGRPFLIVGDAAWSLLAELTDAEVDTYLADRRRHGFNTLLTNLIEHQFSSNAPANAHGTRPFLEAGAFDQPNGRYFDEVGKALRKARERGFLVLLAPAYLGAGGGGQGWFAEMAKSGPDALRAYGRYVGTLYRDLDNIIWVHGGDYDDPDKSLVRAVASGISEADPRALHTVHSSRDTATAEYWRGEPWLSLDTVYTYGDVFEAVSRAFARDAGMPILMIEALYEGEHGTDARQVRAQAYGAMLGGAAGQVYGNNPLWHFSGPGLFGTWRGWRHALGSDGASSIQHFSEFFAPLPWWKIRPDADAVLVAADGDAKDHAICGVASDDTFAIVYMSGAPMMTLKSAWGSRTDWAARWFDPTDGSFRNAAPSVESDATKFAAPAHRNAGGFDDWVLLVEQSE